MTSSNTPDSNTVARLIDHLSNADLRWGGTLVGLVPRIVSDSARQLLDGGDDAIPRLIRALEDESKFVVAHVLLTMLSGVEYHNSPWNGLAIDLSADGEAHVDPQQRFALARCWRAWEQATPRPRSLPVE